MSALVCRLDDPNSTQRGLAVTVPLPSNSIGISDRELGWSDLNTTVLFIVGIPLLGLLDINSLFLVNGNVWKRLAPNNLLQHACMF